MKRPRIGLIGRLVLVVVLVSAVAAVAGGLSLRRASQASLRDEVVRRFEQIAERLAVLADDRVETFADMLRAAATRGPIVHLGSDAVVELRVVLQAIPEFEQLVLYEASGRPLAAAARSHEPDLSTLSPIPGLPGALDGSESTELDVASDEPSLILTVPVQFPPGTAVGVLRGIMRLDDLAGAIEALRVGTSGAAFFVDGTGTVLAHRERDRVASRERFPIERVQPHGSIGRHAVLADPKTGKTILVAAASTQRLDGAVVIQQPESEALGPMEDAFARLMLVLGLVTAAIVAGVMFAARSFLRPLTPLVAAVERFGRGEADARAPRIRGPELGLLASEFNDMADALEERVAALRASEERFRRGFENAPTGMVLASADGRFLKVNRAFCDLVQREEEELIGGSLLLVTHPDDHEADREGMRALVAGELDAYGTEKRYVRPDGSTVHALLSVAMIPGRDGDQAIAFEQVRDITDRKEMEAASEASSKMYEAAYEREHEASQRLRALDEMKNTFLTAVSHELRTPLTSIVGFSETLLSRNGSLDREQTDEFIARIVANARKLDRLLGDLLDLDRMARGIIEPKRHRVDVGEITARTVRDSDAAAGRHVRIDVEAALIDVDPAMFERILENLLANASKHTPPSTPVWVRVRARDGGVELTVEDAGPGVPEHLRENIFRPFDRGGPARQDAPGTGIGLALVARFAELHGGRAWVGERPGGGAAFHVFLPDGEQAVAAARNTAS